jgi:tetratricopeptide (TPR) repeat protein
VKEGTRDRLRIALAEVKGATAPRPRKLASVRMSPAGYLAAAAIFTFASLILLRHQRDLTALMVIACTWIIIPQFIASDRLNFDGERLWRSGPLTFLSRLVFGAPQRLKADEIERVDVLSLRTLRRGGNVRYRYRVELCGAGRSFVFASGGKSFRRMIHELLPRLPDYKLDTRARELRAHLVDKSVLNGEVKCLQIAPVAVLEATSEGKPKNEKRAADKHRGAASAEDLERAARLRKLANELRVAGRLRESAEAFRRALFVSADDGWLIYEYSRLLRSQASAFSDARLLSRARAALRLAIRRSPLDGLLLESIGESFIEFGEAARAARAFHSALNLNEGAYRARLGLAEVGLAEGKLAHAIHHYAEAARIAPDKATTRLAQRETDYYALLNNDDDYLAAELRRMNWLEGADRVQRLTARVTFASLLLALIGPSIDSVVSGIGWALASSSIIGWAGALVIKRFLSARRRAALPNG